MYKLKINIFMKCNPKYDSSDGMAVLGLRMKERPPIWRAAANILNKQSRTADKVWSFRLGFGWGTKNCSP
jgi:hypothetical protein